MIHRTLGLYKGSGQAPHTVPRDAGYILPRILFNSNILRDQQPLWRQCILMQVIRLCILYAEQVICNLIQITDLSPELAM